MKKLLTFFVLGTFLTISACINDGDIGPPGPPGIQGPQGVQGEPGEIGFVMEWEAVNFTATNNYEVILDYAEFDFEGLDSDVALVYLLWDPIEIIWRPLPQIVFHPEGLLQYNYDFTQFDAKVFLDTDFDPDLLQAIDTDDWVVRVVVVPGEFVNGRIDVSDYNKVKEALGLPDLGDRESILRRK